MITTSFDPRTRRWNRGFPDSLAKHDLVYLSPPEDALQGIPIGNGDLGLLLWTEGSRLCAAFNKVDLFDDNPACDGSVENIPYDEEPSLRHGARLTLDFGMPVFDTLYLKNFEARLRLADATAEFCAETPFASLRATAFASNPDGVVVVECEADFGEDNRMDVTVERWGSRPFSYWYSDARREPSIGLSGTETAVSGGTLLIRQQLRTLDFTVGVRMVGCRFAAEIKNSRTGVLTPERASSVRFTLLCTACTSENHPDHEARVLQLLDRAEASGTDRLKKNHTEDWCTFWQASHIRIPNDYVENSWYLNLYYANSASRGSHPMRFTNGIWNWNRDVANWVYYFHWNTQNFIWPLHAANHPELTRPFFDWRTRSLERAKKYAAGQQGLTGAFYADVADRLGNNVGGGWKNHTPGAQIALLYRKHYKYTLDRAFLEEAWPVIREITRYYAALVTRGEDGVYRTLLSQAYEGSPLFDEVVTDTAMIRALMPAAVECARILGCEDGETEHWSEIGANMNGFTTVPMDEDEIETGEDGVPAIRFGLGRGKPVQSGRALCVGIYRMIDGEQHEGFDRSKLPDFITRPLEGVRSGDRLRDRHGNPARPMYYGIPDPEFAPVFPAELVGLRDRESELFRASVDQARIHPSSKPPEKLGEPSMGGSGAMCMGWCPYPVVLARLGLAEEAAAEVEECIGAWQFYVQGFGHYGPYEVFTRDRDSRFHQNCVTDRDTGEKYPSYAWPFRHFTFEAVPIACAAQNEMLLQSHEGLIRLFPAVPEDYEAAFKLAAAGGFIVHAERGPGGVLWAAVESRAGAACSIANPWPGQPAYVTVLDAEGVEIARFVPEPETQGPDEVLAFKTQKDCLYLLCAEADAPEKWEVIEETFEQNSGPKTLGGAMLGLPRMF